MPGANFNTFRVLADMTTMYSLRYSIMADCTSVLASQDSPAVPHDLSSNTSVPRPEQVVQYYRASTVALALDGYTNTATFTEDISAPDTPLLSTVDSALLTCINSTIGSKVPLADWSAESNGIWNSAATPRVDVNAMTGLFCLLLTMILMLS